MQQLDKTSHSQSGKTPVNSGAHVTQREFAKYGWMSVSIYLLFALFFDVVLADPSAKKWIHHVVLYCGCPALLFAYWRGYQTLKLNQPIGIKPIVMFSAISAVCAVLITNFHSKDVLSYVNWGWVQSQYNLNPYVTVPLGCPNYGTDPMLSDNWPYAPCGYGFVFAHAIKLICYLGNGSLQATIFLIKLLNFGIFSALGAVVYQGAKRLGVERPDISLYLYAWSPLILLSSLSNCHNDIGMTFFVMLSFLCATVNIFWLVAPTLFCGIMVKYVWFIAIPFLMLYVWRKGGARALLINFVTGTIAAAVIAHQYIGLWSQYQWDLLFTILGAPIGSPTAAIYYAGKTIGSAFFHNAPWVMGVTQKIISTIQAILLALLAGFSAKSLWQSAKDPNFLTMQKLISIMLVITVSYICVIGSKFHPWYLIMFFPLALWLPEKSDLRKLIMLLSGAQVLAFTSIGNINFLNAFLLIGVPFALTYRNIRKEREFAAIAAAANAQSRSVAQSAPQT